MPTLPGLRARRRQRVGGHLVRGLGHAVGLDHRAAEGGLELRHDLRRQRGRGRADEAQPAAAMRLGVARGAGQDRLVHGRHGRVPGRPSLRRASAKKRSALKPGVQTTLPPAASEDEHRRDQPVDVEQRHDVQAAVVGAERERRPMCAAEAARFA